MDKKATNTGKITKKITLVKLITHIMFKNSMFSKAGRMVPGAMAFAMLAFAACSDDDPAKPNDPANPDGNKSSFELKRDDFHGEIADGEVVLESGTYKLTGKVVVKDGATLTIKSGVTVEATKLSGDRQEIRYIAVAQGGKINVQGTAAEQPIDTIEL